VRDRAVAVAQEFPAPGADRFHVRSSLIEFETETDFELDIDVKKV
jgi:hypothetical protein